MFPSRARRGFTLLEVLASAVIMAAIYAVLSAANIDGAVLEGDANRRLRASLLADSALADLEARIALGEQPEAGLDETQEEEFTVRVDVGPLELPFDQWLPEREDAAQRSTSEPSLLRPRGRGPPMLSQIQVSVAWFDGVRDREVRRTSFLLDREQSRVMLEQAGVGSEELFPDDAGPDS